MLQSKLLCWNQKHALYGRMHPFQELSFQILSFSGIVFSDLIPYPFQELSFQTLSFSGIIFPDFILFRTYLIKIDPSQEVSFQIKKLVREFFQIISLQEILITRLSEHTLNKCLSLFEALDHIKAGV